MEDIKVNSAAESLEVGGSSEQSMRSPESITLEEQGSNRKKRVRTSPVWDKFHEKTFDGIKKACCNYCNQEFRISSRSGTSHLKRHLDRCRVLQEHVNNALLSQTDKEEFQFDQMKTRHEIACMILEDELSFSVVESRRFRRVCASLNPDFSPISRNTIVTDCRNIYISKRSDLQKEFKFDSGRICLTMDMWTSNQTLSYMSLTAHYITRDWKLQKRIIKFSVLEPPHSGPFMAKAMLNFLAEWEIECNVSSITLDSASSNDRMCSSMRASLVERDVLPLNGRLFHFRCCSHILNLIVQDGLEEISSALVKIRESIKYVDITPSKKQRFQEAVQQAEIINKKGLCLDVATRWNSTYLMLESALLYKRAFVILESFDNNFTSAPSGDEWLNLEKIYQILKLFFMATKLFSGTKYVTINLCLNEIMKIHYLLRNEAEKNNSVTSSMARRMKLKFDKYWDDSEDRLDTIDNTLVLAIAAVLDPYYKIMFLEYAFAQIYGDEASSNVDRVMKDIHALYFEYANLQSTTISSFENQETSYAAEEENEYDIPTFDQYVIAKVASKGSKSELDVYLEEPMLPRPHYFDILNWWKVHQSKYPILAKMARDILAIPASTVASESAFSIGGRIINDYRSSLLPDNVEVLVCGQDWVKKEDIE